MRNVYGNVYYRVLSVFLTICMVTTLSGIGTMPVHAETSTGRESQENTVSVNFVIQSPDNLVTQSPENGENDGLQLLSLDDKMAADIGIDLATLSDGATLTSGVYYLSESKTFGSASTMNNGLKISDGATVYIYIPNGITLTAIGGGTNTNRTTGGYAGILLPENTNLIILGEGSLEATGGRAGNGTSGSSGTSGTLSVGNYYYGGSGGAGGAGGGGAGAGIGTNGGKGGSGGTATGNGTKIESGDSNYDGASGNSGYPGGKGAICGTLYVQNTIMLTATGGGNGSKGGGGSAGSCSYSSTKWDDKTYHVAGGGGGGGGGGAGYSANGVGTGGAAGGGGGSGGRGGIDYSNSSYGSPNTNATCNGAGGYGGYGSTNGTNGSGSRDGGTYSDKWDQTGGTGGGRGSEGSGSVQKSVLTSGWTNKNFTVTFKGVDSEIVSQTDYIFGTQGEVTVPEYTAEAGSCFLGWEVDVFGATTSAGAELTSTSLYTDVTVYQPGQVITIEAGVSGSIELKPIIGTLSGTSAQTEVLTIPAQEMEQEVTYYTYTVETTLDGVATDMGNLTLEDEEGKSYTISYEDGKYSYITSEDEIYTIHQNGKSLGATVTAGETAVIPYKTLTITTTLNGSSSIIPGEVTIAGADNLGLTTNRNSGIYTAVDLATNTNEYRIFVGGIDTGETISLGKTKTLAYYSTTIHIGGNTAAESVALRENNGDKTYILEETSSNQFVLVEPATEGTYTLYVNGFKTEYTSIHLSQENSFHVNVFTTAIITTLNGEPTDMDLVMVGAQQAIHESVGRYTVLSVMTEDAPTETVTISDRNVGSVTIGTEKTISYYSVEYTNGSTEANILPIDNRVYLANDEVTVLSAVTPKDNAYTFAGWKVSETVKQPGDTFIMPAAKVQIPVNWNETVYNIAYELEEPGASNHVNNPETYTISKQFTLEEPTLEGYIFEGWTYGDVTIPTKDVTIEQGTTGDLTFVAHWIVKTYEICGDRGAVDFGSKIDGYSGESMQEIIGITSVGNQTITLNTPECDNDNFVIDVSQMEYSLTGNGGYTEFTIKPKDGLADGTYSGNITVSTQEGNTVTIPVDFEVGIDSTPPDASITVGENVWDDIIFESESNFYYNREQSITIEANDTEKGVAEIKYYISTQPLVWSDDEVDWLGTNGTLLTEWNVYDSSNKPVISDVGTYYVYAKVTDNENPSNITDICTDTLIIDKTAPNVEFIDETQSLSNNGIYQGKKQVKVLDECLTAVSLNDQTCEISENGSCTFTIDPNEDVVQKIVATDQAGNVTTIYLTINPCPYTVTYDLNGGIGSIENGIAKEQIAYKVSDGSEVTPPKGKRFVHWAVGALDATVTIEASGTYVFDDHTTLYAIWEYIPYRIEYNLNGGINALTNPTTYTIITEDIILAEPSKDGYIFDGWTWEATEGIGENEQSTPVKEVTISTNSIGDKVFTANWIEKEYTIASDKDVDGILFDTKLEYVYTTESIPVRITNTGNWRVNLNTPTSDESNSAFVIGEYSNTVVEPGKTVVFTVSTKEKLDVGSYMENITVETAEGTSVNIPVSFTVRGDYNAPTGSITIKNNKWTEVLNVITFDFFFKETQEVMIEGEDLINGVENNTGVRKMYYYLSETALNKSELENLPTDAWIEYEENFTIDPDCILTVYAKIIDNAENITYVSSDGLVFDATAPVILGVEDGKVYCESQRITVYDDNLERVVVSGNEVPFTDKTYEFLATEGEYVISASDKAGNMTSITAIVAGAHDMSDANCTEASTCKRENCEYTEGTALGHDWSGEWSVIKEATATEEGKMVNLCVRNCGQKRVASISMVGEPEADGNFEKHVEIEPEAPIHEATLDNSKNELLEDDSIFSEDERDQIRNGTDARVWIEISKTDESAIAVADKSKIEQEAINIMGENPNITYFDADLFKQIGNGNVTKITELNVAVKITIKLPDELLNRDKTISREYKVLRLHDSQVEVISGTFDTITGEFSFESDKFSTYAIVYNDVPVEDNTGENNTPGGDGNNTPGGGGSNTPGGGGNNTPDDGGSNTPDDGGNKKPDNGGNKKPDNGGNKKPDNGGNKKPDNGGNNNPGNGGSDKPGNGGSDKPGNGGSDNPGNGGNNNPGNGGGDKPGNGGTDKQTDGKSDNPRDDESNELALGDKPDYGEYDKPADDESNQSNDGENEDNPNGDNSNGDNPNGDNPNDSENDNNPNGGKQLKKKEANVVTSIPKEQKEQLKDAVEEIQDKIPTIQPGPYVQIPKGQDETGNESESGNENGNESGKQQFTMEIPEELVKDGRGYYLVTVDEKGNIVILQNEGIKDGVLTFTGNPNAIYQLIYEDNNEDDNVHLANMLNRDGQLIDEKGAVITVDTNHCFWHYIIIALALIGMAFALFFRDKRKNQLLAVGILTLLLIIFVVIGWCTWDILFAILAEVALAAIIICSKNKQEDGR